MEARAKDEATAEEIEHSDDDPLCVLALDWANAFNRVGRAAIHSALEEYCPNLLPLFRWAYKDGSAVSYRNAYPTVPLFATVKQGSVKAIP